VTASGEATVETGDNRYSVQMRRDERGWIVAILAPDGREASVRACGDEAEARTYASTVRQHIGWLSERAFRAYYRLSEGE
jgi:hypothetical protein